MMAEERVLILPIIEDSSTDRLRPVGLPAKCQKIYSARVPHLQNTETLPIPIHNLFLPVRCYIPNH